MPSSCSAPRLVTSLRCSTASFRRRLANSSARQDSIYCPEPGKWLPSARVRTGPSRASTRRRPATSWQTCWMKIRSNCSISGDWGGRSCWRLCARGGRLLRLPPARLEAGCRDWSGSCRCLQFETDPTRECRLARRGHGQLPCQTFRPCLYRRRILESQPCLASIRRDRAG